MLIHATFLLEPKNFPSIQLKLMMALAMSTLLNG